MRVIYNKLLPIDENSKGLLEGQCCFRRLYSTANAISMVENLAKYALVSGSCCAILEMDVQNSANLNRIKGALANVGIFSMSNRKFSLKKDFLLWDG